jgi:DNA polymerase III gamma/tau subunit
MNDHVLDGNATRPRTNILRWEPRRWDECIANTELKKFLQGEAREIRGLLDREKSLRSFRRRNVMVSGALRTGKTSQCKLFLRSLTCEALDEHLNPCEGSCGPCSNRVATVGETGLDTTLRYSDGRPRVDVKQIDCGRVSLGEFKEIIDSIPFEANDLLVVLCDEAHRLAAKQADELLLKVTEERDCMFILATVAPEKLDPMVKARFTHFRTQLPTPEELGQFLMDRCNEWELPIDEYGLISLIKRSGCIPGIALHALDHASVTGQDLTEDFVMKQWVPPID